MGALHSNRMAANTSPTEDEIDRFVELYEEIGTTSGVAEHDDVDWSRPTVTKHLKRRGAIEDNSSSDSGESEDESQPEPEPEPEPADGGTMVEEVEQSVPIEEQFDDILEDEPPTPNDILWDVLSADPDLKDKHVEYLRRFEDQYGVFSPDDVSGKLSELKITNKRMTINRAVSNYRTEINRKLQKNEDLAQREEWALLLTKTTGNPRYLREADAGGSAAQFEQAGPAIEGPAGGQQQARGDQIQAPAPGGQPRQNAADRGRERQPYQQRQQNGAPGVNGQQPQGAQPQVASQPDPMPDQPAGTGQQPAGQEQGLNKFQQKVLEMLEQQLDSGPSQPEPTTSESDSLTSQIQEIAEIQETLDSMGGGGGENEELTQAIQQINEQVDQKLARLEAKVAEMDSGGGGQQTPVAPSNGEGGTMSEIAALAQQIEDPDVLSTVIESQMDPEVIKAKAETEEVENDAQFKRALAEALSPAATEKAIEAFSNLTNGISTAAEQAQQQPRQPQQAQQPQRQPQQAQQPQQGQARDVEVVEDDAGPAEEPAMSDPAEATEESSPLREQGEEELAETDTPDETDEEVEE